MAEMTAVSKALRTVVELVASMELIVAEKWAVSWVVNLVKTVDWSVVKTVYQMDGYMAAQMVATTDG